MSAPPIDSRNFETKFYFYKEGNKKEKVTVSLVLTANHEFDEDVYHNLKVCLEGMIEDIMEDDYYDVDKYNLKDEVYFN